MARKSRWCFPVVAQAEPIAQTQPSAWWEEELPWEEWASLQVSWQRRRLSKEGQLSPQAVVATSPRTYWQAWVEKAQAGAGPQAAL